MKHKILLFFLSFLFFSCISSENKKQQNDAEVILTNKETINESQKMEMFCIALKDHSTAPFYVVITVKNLNTSEVKEICTEAPFLNGAINFQFKKSCYSLDCNDYPNRYFEFSSDSALWNISFDEYSISELEEYKKTLNIGLIIKHIKEGKLSEREFGYDNDTFGIYLSESNPSKENEEESSILDKDWEKLRKQQLMFAHIMFNNGILVSRGCISGNHCVLYPYQYVKNK